MTLNDIRNMAHGRQVHVTDDILKRYVGMEPEEIERVLRCHERLAIVKSRLIRHHPFFATILLAVEVFMGKTMFGTAETNGDFIRISPEFIEQLSNPEIEGVLVHEIMHIMSLHHIRMKKRQPMIWNMAGDHAINLELLRAGFTLPEGGLQDTQYENMSTEEIYQDVYDKADKIDVVSVTVVATDSTGNTDPSGNGAGSTVVDMDNGEDAGSDGGDKGDDGGSGTGDTDSGGSDDGGDEDGDADASGQDQTEPEQPWNWGAVLDASKGLSDSELTQKETETKIKVQQAALSAKAMGCGEDVGIAERIIECYDDDTDWKEFLREFVKDSFDKDDYSWSRPNRRYMQSGVYLPNMTGQNIDDIVVAIDVSGSIDSGQLNRFGAALSSLLLESPRAEVTVLYCDTTIQLVEELTSADLPLKLKTPGGGGTSFTPPFKYVEDKDLDPKCFIYFTDMECGQFPDEPDYPVLWICFVTKAQFKRYSQYYKGAYIKFPPFGELICMDPPGTSC